MEIWTIVRKLVKNGMFSREYYDMLMDYLAPLFTDVTRVITTIIFMLIIPFFISLDDPLLGGRSILNINLMIITSWSPSCH